MSQTKRTRYNVVAGRPVREDVVYVEPLLPSETEDACAARLVRMYEARYGITDGLHIEVVETHDGRRGAYVTVEARNDR